MKIMQDIRIPIISSETEKMAATIASFAELPLAAGRGVAVASILTSWLPDANELSRKMSAPIYQHLVPATVFAHPACFDDEAT